MAPPTTKIDWVQVDKMCQIQCTGEEIASVLNISYDTLERAVKREKKISCADYIQQKAQGGKASLRRMQWKLAEDGNATMLIWLGKNILEQSDKADLTSDITHNYYISGPEKAKDSKSWHEIYAPVEIKVIN